MSVTISPMQRAILASLIERPRTAKDLADEVYADDTNGGPATAETIIRMQARRLRAIGIMVGGHVGGRGSQGYRIAPESLEMVSQLLARAAGKSKG